MIGCLYGDISYQILPEDIRPVLREAVEKAFLNPGSKLFPHTPVEIKKSRVTPKPEWDGTMLQYPIRLADGPEMHISPFRLIFSKPKLLTTSAGGTIALSVFQDVVVASKKDPSAAYTKCDSSLFIEL
ncbi:hypothetical protein RhiJN_22530 [Ceratobasidium sp. AG-Ba]|nr:hypothetical protein RhiJN_22530 [Ceratobasidium sp. AG-Ba]